MNIAQNHPGENTWDGYELLNLPNAQINRSAISGTIGQVGSIYDQKRAFIVTAEDIINALVAQGKNPNTVNSFYIYFELHLARTSIFSRDLQKAYASGVPAGWGGYIYDTLDFDPIGYGSGPETGSSGHFGMLDVKGSRDVQLPDAPETYRTVTGKKFLDANNNGMFDVGESGLPNWTIKLIGKIEDILVPLETKTDANGVYTFGGLSYGSELLVYEMMVPNYMQTYPNKVESLPIGAVSYKEDVLGEGSWRWRIPSMLMPDQGDTIISGVDFGNFLPDPKIEVTKTGDELSKIGDTIKFTVTVKNTGNVPLNLVSISDDKFGPLDAGSIANGFGPSLAVGATESHEFEMIIPETEDDPFINKVTAVYKYMEVEAKGEATHETNLFKPSYTIEKKVDKAKAVPGETVHYTVTVKNTSSLDTPETTFVLTDELLGFKDATAKTFKLLPGQSKTFDGDEMNYVIPEDSERGSVIKNEASYVTSFENFPNVYDGSASAETTVVYPIIKITKDGDALSKIGDEVTYTFEVENIGDVPLELVKVYDDSFKHDLTALFAKKTLAVGEKEKVTQKFTIPADAADPFINSVTATFKYVNGLFTKEVSSSDTHTVELFQPGITIEKTADKDVSMTGDTITYKIIVKNTSSMDAPNLIYSVVDDHAGNVVTDAEFQSGESKEYTYTYIIKPEDVSPVKNTASVTASPNILDASDSHEVKLFVPDITIEKTADTEISKVGDTINYTITVKNLTKEDFAPDMKVHVTDPMLGIDMNFSLPSGDIKEIKKAYVVKASDDPDYMTKLGWTELTNTATLIASPDGFEKIAEFELEDSVTVDLVHPHINLEKSVDLSMAHVGDTVTYKVKITNTGDVELVNIVVTDSMVGVLGGFVDSLLPGASDEKTYTRLLTTADIGQLKNTASVLANPITLPNEIIDSDDATVEVRQRLYEETGWAYGGPTYAKEINKLVNSAKWGWTNGPLPEGNYKFPIYTGAGQNDINKGLLAGYLFIEYHDKTVKFRYEMEPGFSLKKVHLYVGETPLPEKKQGKNTVLSAEPGQFTYKPSVSDQATTFEYEVKLKKAGDIYIASHTETYVPFWEMNAFYNTTKY